MKSGFIIGLGLLLALLSVGCTHQKVAVHQITDASLTCAQIAHEITRAEAAKEEIADKTGLSGRNIGMGLVFWPGIVVNEIQGSSAEEAANKRLDKLHGLYREKQCIEQSH